ncbi:hypothetical protein FA13DRAFT_1750751 [Coprinellus micaceus]|uniref:COQ9 C-terminal domain-containing protein n=1 Tax=Coprinellus micaceus TaxID=71717 RepID=A0A4Y7R4N3_COPMI|nr:hypothetical protein FA13DRAFT_1750751 [Coprinellus micaceus]
MASSSKLLKLALPFVRTHGFSREALCALQAHSEPLSDTAVSSLFGEGDNARRTLVNAWLAEGVRHMQTAEEMSSPPPQLREAFGLLATPSSGFHVIAPFPALKHAGRIADEACYAIGDNSLHLSWYSKRASISLVSPNTAYTFLDTLLETSQTVSKSLDEVSLFSDYVFKGWKGIIKSSGIQL